MKTSYRNCFSLLLQITQFIFTYGQRIIYGFARKKLCLWYTIHEWHLGKFLWFCQLISRSIHFLSFCSCTRHFLLSTKQENLCIVGWTPSKIPECPVCSPWLTRKDWAVDAIIATDCNSWWCNYYAWAYKIKPCRKFLNHLRKHSITPTHTGYACAIMNIVQSWLTVYRGLYC